MSDPYVNLCLAILKESKKARTLMWRDFQKTNLYETGMKGNVNSFAIALWVAEYIE